MEPRATKEEPITAAAIRVVVADDHPIIVDDVQNVLAQYPEICLVGVARSFAMVSEVLNQTTPDVIVLDVSGMGGSVLNLMSRLQREYARVGVVIFSSMVDLAPELLDAGARENGRRCCSSHRSLSASRSSAR